MVNLDDLKRQPGWRARRTPAEEQADPDAWRAGLAWIQEQWGGKGCPYCGTKNWWVGSPVELSTVTGLGAGPPMFPITCTKCGQTAFVNALVAGFKSDTDGSEDG